MHYILLDYKHLFMAQKIDKPQNPALRKTAVISRLRWSMDEKLELKRWLESGWDWEFPGYKQAALHINSIFGNNRTATACRMMDKNIVANGL